MGINRHRLGLRIITAGVLFGALVPVSGAGPAPGRISQETLAGDLRYTLSVPDSHGSGAAAPLVVSLHYGGPVSPWYGRGLLEQVVEPALRPLAAVMVAPDCPQRAWVDCRTAVDQIVAQVQREHGTAQDCVIITGYSKGGIGTWELVSGAPSRYAAAVVMAARAPEPRILAGWRTPVRVIHGQGDELFPLAPVAAATQRLAADGVDAALEVLDGATHYDTGRFEEPLARLVGWLRDRCRRP